MASVYSEDDLVPLSALQHFLFCKRQCALIHLERVWAENLYTAQGRIMHKRVHKSSTNARTGKLTQYGMPIRSLALGLIGKADAVERFTDGRMMPVEFKRGRPKTRNMDEVQLCAQAICLEEMLGVRIEEGALYYGKTRKRKRVAFTEHLRSQAAQTANSVHALIAEGKTPPPVYAQTCRRCSLIELCLPKALERRLGVASYIQRQLQQPVAEAEDPV
jgi:CRISPR-associated exonuclease Cas4